MTTFTRDVKWSNFTAASLADALMPLYWHDSLCICSVNEQLISLYGKPRTYRNNQGSVPLCRCIDRSEALLATCHKTGFLEVWLIFDQATLVATCYTDISSFQTDIYSGSSLKWQHLFLKILRIKWILSL